MRYLITLYLLTCDQANFSVLSLTLRLYMVAQKITLIFCMTSVKGIRSVKNWPDRRLYIAYNVWG